MNPLDINYGLLKSLWRWALKLLNEYGFGLCVLLDIILKLDLLMDLDMNCA